MKRVLVITYYWPPSGGSGVQRWVKFAKYLPQEGWEPVIYAPENADYPSTDLTMGNDLPDTLEVIRRPIREPYAIYRRLMGKSAKREVTEISSGKKTWKQRLSLWIRANIFVPDHFHVSVICSSVEDLSAFMRDATSCYAKAFNRKSNRTGPLFCEQFGSAPKKTDKHVRTNMIYVDNNPVERKLCSKAEDYRWNFLAFANTEWPFSQPGIRRYYSGAMKRAVAMVVARHKSGKYLTFDMLQNAFAKLSRTECNQLTDFIISTYSVIDYEESMNHFGSYESMLLAIHSTTGSEYDLKEHFNGKRDDVYAKLINILLKQGLVKDIHDVVSLPIERKLYLQRLLAGKTLATANQIACFLHLPAQS